MINEPLKRGQLCYWKRNTTYSEISFVALIPMPVAPHAVKAIKGGEEYILKDCEVFTSLKEAFCDKHKRIIEALVNRGKESKAALARRLGVPYSRIFSVISDCKQMGVQYEK